MKQFLAIFWLALLLATNAKSADQTNGAIRFATIDIFVDSKEEILAAYQLEWSSESSDAKIVGIEGGENAAFTEPPYYDPKAIQQERIILAAFSTAEPKTLPTGKTRIATIHLQLSGNKALDSRIRSARAARPDGKKITVEASFLERKSQ